MFGGKDVATHIAVQVQAELYAGHSFLMLMAVVSQPSKLRPSTKSVF